ncbi:MAG: 7-keto-8-aminopelargonate synthetase-like enzyme [Hyphomonas sp.]|jgi:7-keto-8-aminopelargonate synthetase-like enzyme
MDVLRWDRAVLLAGEHPIVPVMLYDAHQANMLAEALLKRGVFVIAFSYPVVPKGKARIRCQMSAAITREEFKKVVEAFAAAKSDVAKQLSQRPVFMKNSALAKDDIPNL